MTAMSAPQTGQAGDVVERGTAPRAADAPGSQDRRGNDRRRRPTAAISRYSFFGGRRRGDRRSPNAANIYVDVYEPWLAGVLVAIGVLCALDAVFTLVYLQKGGEEARHSSPLRLRRK